MWILCITHSLTFFLGILFIAFKKVINEKKFYIKHECPICNVTLMHPKYRNASATYNHNCSSKPVVTTLCVEELQSNKNSFTGKPIC